MNVASARRLQDLSQSLKVGSRSLSLRRRPSLTDSLLAHSPPVKTEKARKGKKSERAARGESDTRANERKKGQTNEEKQNSPRVDRLTSTGVRRARRSERGVARTAGRLPRSLVVRPSRAPVVPFARFDLPKGIQIRARGDDTIREGACAFRAQRRRPGGALLRLGDLRERAARTPVMSERKG